MALVDFYVGVNPLSAFTDCWMEATGQCLDNRNLPDPPWTCTMGMDLLCLVVPHGAPAFDTMTGAVYGGIPGLPVELWFGDTLVAANSTNTDGFAAWHINPNCFTTADQHKFKIVLKGPRGLLADSSAQLYTPFYGSVAPCVDCSYNYEFVASDYEYETAYARAKLYYYTVEYPVGLVNTAAWEAHQPPLLSKPPQQDYYYNTYNLLR